MAALPTARPLPSVQRAGPLLRQRLRLPGARRLAAEYGFELHLHTRGEEEAQAKLHEPGWKARRWVVERTHSWLNRFRRLLIRWDKQAANFQPHLHFTCALIA